MVFLSTQLAAIQQPAPAIPIVIEDVRFMPPQQELARRVAITVRNAGVEAIDAWGVTGEVRYTNHATRRIGVLTDTYETQLLPERLKSPAAESLHLPPGGRATITTGVPDVPLVDPVGAAVSASFAVFEDNFAVGDETQIEFTFARRRLHQRVWRRAGEALADSQTRGMSADEALAALAAAMRSMDDESRGSVAYSILRRIMASSSSSAEKLAQLELEVRARGAATERHAERRRFP
jgi:hypothetical protein